MNEDKLSDEEIDEILEEAAVEPEKPSLFEGLKRLGTISS